MSIDSSVYRNVGVTLVTGQPINLTQDDFRALIRYGLAQCDGTYNRGQLTPDNLVDAGVPLPDLLQERIKPEEFHVHNMEALRIALQSTSLRKGLGYPV